MPFKFVKESPAWRCSLIKSLPLAASPSVSGTLRPSPSPSPHSFPLTVTPFCPPLPPLPRPKHSPPLPTSPPSPTRVVYLKALVARRSSMLKINNRETWERRVGGWVGGREAEIQTFADRQTERQKERNETHRQTHTDRTKDKTPREITPLPSPPEKKIEQTNKHKPRDPIMYQ